MFGKLVVTQDCVWRKKIVLILGYEELKFSDSLEYPINWEGGKIPSYLYIYALTCSMEILCLLAFLCN